MDVFASMFRSSSSDSGSDTEPAVSARHRHCGKSRRASKRRHVELELAVAKARLKLVTARLKDAEATAPTPLKCPLTLKPVSDIAAPVSVGQHIVDVSALVAYVDHKNPNGNTNNPSTFRVPHFTAPNEYGTLGFAVSVVTEAQQQMYGARKTPLSVEDGSAVDLVMRLLKHRRRAPMLVDTDTESDSDFR